MWWLLAPMALAQSVPNGDFSDALEGWSGEGMEEGRSPQAPSPERFLTLQAEEITAWAASSPFVITRTELEWHRRGFIYDWAVMSGEQAVASGTDSPLFSWLPTREPVEGSCGLEVVFLASIFEDETWVSFDSFVLAGAACPEFDDRDGDGYCVRGIDLDGNGDCADDLELSDAVEDCNDQDPNAYPTAKERVASGVDEDCDGEEACYEDLDGDGFGSSVVVSSAQLDCRGEGIAPNPNDQCEGFDDALDADGNGIPDGCEPDPLPPVPPALMGRFRGGGCACSASSTWSWWAWWSWLARR